MTNFYVGRRWRPKLYRPDIPVDYRKFPVVSSPPRPAILDGPTRARYLREVRR